MSHLDDPHLDDPHTAPPARTGLLVIAGVLLLIPIVALMWVSSYASADPHLGAFPFFIWYQFLWVFLASAFTYTAYRLVRKARPYRALSNPDDRHDEETDR